MVGRLRGWWEWPWAMSTAFLPVAWSPGLASVTVEEDLGWAVFPAAPHLLSAPVQGSCPLRWGRCRVSDGLQRTCVPQTWGLRPWGGVG